MPILEFLAQRLKELRRRHNLTQEQAAALLGTDLRWYQRIESKSKDIRASTIDRIAAAFGLSAMQLLGEALPETKLAKLPQEAPHRPKRSASAKAKS